MLAYSDSPEKSLLMSVGTAAANVIASLLFGLILIGINGKNSSSHQFTTKCNGDKRQILLWYNSCVSVCRV